MPWSTFNSPRIVGFWLLDTAWFGVTSPCLVLGFQSFSSHQLTSLKRERWCTTSSWSSFLERNRPLCPLAKSDKPKPRNGVSVKWRRQNQIDLMGIIGEAYHNWVPIVGGSLESPLIEIPNVSDSACCSRTLRSRKIRISAARKRSCRRRRTRPDLSRLKVGHMLSQED